MLDELFCAMHWCFFSRFQTRVICMSQFTILRLKIYKTNMKGKVSSFQTNLKAFWKIKRGEQKIC